MRKLIKKWRKWRERRNRRAIVAARANIKILRQTCQRYGQQNADLKRRLSKAWEATVGIWP